MKKNIGYTLLEVLAVVGISSVSTLAVKEMVVDEFKSEQRSEVIKEISSVIEAVDYRLAIDGFNMGSWSKSSWVNKQEIQDLIQGELNQQTACGGGKWEPSSVNPKIKESLVNCSLWSDNSLSGKYEIEADLGTDLNGFIDSFRLTLKFNDSNSFEENFLHLKTGLNKNLSSEDKKMSGYTSMRLVDINNKQESLSSFECIEIQEDCAIEAVLERGSEGDFVRTEGEDSVLYNLNLSFTQNAGDAPLDCARWKKGSDGIWVMSNLSDNECGIGLYSGDPLVVEVVAETGTFENIAMTTECVLYEIVDNEYVNKGRTSPCGMFNESSEIIQVFDNTMSNFATISKTFGVEINSESLESKDLILGVVELSSLTTGVVNSDNVEVLSDLVSEKKSTFNGVVENFVDFEVVNGTSLDFEKGVVVSSFDSDGDAIIDGVVGGIYEASANTINMVSLSDSVNKVGSAAVKDIRTNEIKVNGNLQVSGEMNEVEVISNNFVVPDLKMDYLIINNEAYANEVSAPIGNFKNIDERLSDIESKYESLNQDIYDNYQDMISAEVEINYDYRYFYEHSYTWAKEKEYYENR